MKNTFAFASESITVNGIQFPASYSVSAKSGDVYVFAIVKPSADEPDMPVRIHIATGMPMHAEALAAAQAAKAEPAPAPKAAEPAPAPAAEPAPVDKPAGKPARKAKAPKAAKPAKVEPTPAAKAEPAPVDKPAAKPARKAKAPKAAKPAKVEPAPAPVAEPAPATNADKPWIGTRIEGAGWHIAFDADAGRTRVVFADAPSAAQKSAIEAAGFFWSAQLKSWNKKLTCKAYRAAQALAANLAALA